MVTLSLCDLLNNRLGCLPGEREELDTLCILIAHLLGFCLCHGSIGAPTVPRVLTLGIIGSFNSDETTIQVMSVMML